MIFNVEFKLYFKNYGEYILNGDGVSVNGFMFNYLA